MNKAAQALGRLARGVPKKFSAAELKRRRELMAGINARKRKESKAKKRRMPNAQAEAQGEALLPPAPGSAQKGKDDC